MIGADLDRERVRHAGPPRRPGAGRRLGAAGFSLVEVLMGAGIGVALLLVLVPLFTGGLKLGVGETEILGLQIEAQKSLAVFMRDLQQGMLVIVPQPGSTQPQAVVRDHRNRLIHYALIKKRPDGATGDLVRAEVTPAGSTVRPILSGVCRVAFTSISDGALRIHLILQENERRFAFHTQVRMRNRDAAES